MPQSRKTHQKKRPAKEPPLSPDRRVCIHCGSSTTAAKTQPGDPSIMTVSLIVYRHNGKKQLRATPKLNLCEECIVRAVTGSPRTSRPESITLLNAVRNRLAACYNTMQAEDRT